MASASLLSPKDREPLKCVNDPNFAAICAFLEQFAVLCGIEHPNFLDLQRMLENDEVHADLIDVHVKLLRKLRFSVNVERWERSLAKFCHTYSTNDAWELERFAYRLLKLPIRLRILKHLLETQFDNNPKFKNTVNALDSGKLRPVPLGRDKMGNVYWRTLDADCNIRIYQENQDEESLRIVASNRDELAKLIAVLSGKEPMPPNLAGLVDEDSSSNSDIVTAPVAEEPKDNIVQKDPGEDDEEEEKLRTEPPSRQVEPTTPSTPTSRITLLGKNNLDKINKFKLMNAKKKSEEEEESEEMGDDEEDEEEDEDNYDDDDMDVEPEVSSVIQERVVYIRGEGAGKSNKCGNIPVNQEEEEDEFACSEAVEEPMMYFSGQGAGRECDVGNPGEGSNNNNGEEQKKAEGEIAAPSVAPKPLLPKPMFFFGRPGCLKLSPMKPEEKKDGQEEDQQKKKLSLVAYDDSNSASSNSQDSQGDDKVKSNEDKSSADKESIEEGEGTSIRVENDKSKEDDTQDKTIPTEKEEKGEENHKKSEESEEKIDESQSTGASESKEDEEVQDNQVQQKQGEVVQQEEMISEPSEKGNESDAMQVNEEKGEIENEIVSQKESPVQVDPNEDQEGEERKAKDQEMESNVSDEVDKVTAMRLMTEERISVDRPVQESIEKRIEGEEKTFVEEPEVPPSAPEGSIMEEHKAQGSQINEDLEPETPPQEVEKDQTETIISQPMVSEEEEEGKPSTSSSVDLNLNQELKKVEQEEQTVDMETDDLFEDQMEIADQIAEASLDAPIESKDTELVVQELQEAAEEKETIEIQAESLTPCQQEVVQEPVAESIEQMGVEPKEEAAVTLDHKEEEVSANIPEERLIDSPSNDLEPEEEIPVPEKDVSEDLNIEMDVDVQGEPGQKQMPVKLQEEEESNQIDESPQEEIISPAAVSSPIEQPVQSESVVELLEDAVTPRDHESIAQGIEEESEQVAEEETPRPPLKLSAEIQGEIADHESIAEAAQESASSNPKPESDPIEDEIPESPVQEPIATVEQISPEALIPPKEEEKEPEQVVEVSEIEKELSQEEDSQSSALEIDSDGVQMESPIEQPKDDAEAPVLLASEEREQEQEIADAQEEVSFPLPQGAPELLSDSNLATESQSESIPEVDDKGSERGEQINLPQEESLERDQIELRTPVSAQESIKPVDEIQKQEPSVEEEPPPIQEREESLESPLETMEEEPPLPQEIETVSSEEPSPVHVGEPSRETPVQIDEPSISQSLAPVIVEDDMESEPEVNQIEEAEVITAPVQEATPTSSVKELEEEEDLQEEAISMPEYSQTLKGPHQRTEEEDYSRGSDQLSSERPIEAAVTQPPQSPEAVASRIIPSVESSPESVEEKVPQEIIPTEEPQPMIQIPVDLPASPPPVIQSVPGAEELSDNESEDNDAGHFDQGPDINEPMEEDHHEESDEEEVVPHKAPEQEPEEEIVLARREPEEEEETQSVRIVADTPVIPSTVESPYQEEEIIPEKEETPEEKQDEEEESRMEIDEPQESIKSPSPPPPQQPLELVSQSRVPVEPEPEINTTAIPQDPIAEEPSIPPPVSEDPEPEIPEESEPLVTAAPPPVAPTRSRRGRRSDPVVAALGEAAEIITETPRTTRGRANNKESPKVAVAAAAAAASTPAVKTPPQPRKNSRKRKSSESTVAPAAVQSEPVEATKEPEAEVKVAEKTQPIPVKEEELPSTKVTEPVKVEPEPQKHDSEGDDEEEDATARPSGRKAPARGRKGRKGRKAPPPKKTPVSTPVPPPATEKPEPSEEVAVEEKIPVKSEPTEAPIKQEEKPEPETIPPPAESETPKPKKGRRANRMMGLYVDEIQPQEDAGSVRASRRIAQIKIKEETDRRLQEEVALDKMKDSMKKKPDSSGDEDSGSEKGKGKGRGKKSKKGGLEKEKKPKTSWHSNSNSSEEDEKDEDEFNFGVVEEDPGSPLFKSDHEFSCESDVDGDEFVPTKMARTAKAKKKAKDDSSESEDDNPDHTCQKCGKHDHPEWILLCDTCDKGYHCSCLLPVLFIIPEGDWYCPQCQHTKLLEQLTLQLEELDNALVLKEREAEMLRRQAMHNICAENILPKDTVEKEEKQLRKSPTDRRGSGPEEDSEEEQDSEDSDDMPIYKLRRRKQNKVSYRFNDYDELINKAIGHDRRDDRALNEIIQEGEGAAGEERKAGNLGRGKDISTIMEADENEKTRKELSQSDASGSGDSEDDDVPLGVKRKANVGGDSDDSEVIRKPGKKSSGKGKSSGKKGKSGGRKKNRKLNNLDSSSDDDGSDEDFEGSSADESDSAEQESGSLDSDSSMELAMYRKKNKRGGTTTRRSGRARVKRFDNDFINDNDDDDSAEKAPPPKRTKKKKKEESDFSDFDEDDDELAGSSDENEEQDLDSADLCDDSESEDSEDRPWGSKKKKKAAGSPSKVFSKKPILSAGKVPRNPKRKGGDDEEEDDEKPFKASIPKKKKPVIASDDDDDEEEGKSTPAESSRPARRTRGKKINFLEVDESGSSDDGIKPGVKRPDTPPEEREQFIKRQEEIKKMLAAKNTQAALQAATPKLEPLKLKLSGAASSSSSAQDPNSLSTIPRNIIQSAKALDTEFVKSRDSGGEEFDDELPDDFNPEDMDMEEDLDRMMEEDGDFAVQQLKMAGEAPNVKSKKQQKMQKEEKKQMAGSLLEPLQPVSAQPPQELLANKPPGYPPLGHPMQHMIGGPQPIPPHSVIQGMPPRGHLPPPPHLIPDGQQPPGQRHPHPMHQMGMNRMPLLPPNMMPQGHPGHGGPPMGMRFMHHGGPPGMPPGASGMPQNVIVGPQQHGMQPGPSFLPYGSPSGVPLPPQSAAASIPPPGPQNESPKAVPKKRGRKPKETAAAVVPPPQLGQPPGGPVALLPGGPPLPPGGESGIPTTVLAHEANATPPKKGGRRKKITPSREELQAAQAAQAAAAAAAVETRKPDGPEPRGSILSERLEAGADPKHAAAPPPVAQSLAAQPPYNPSVIQRLPQPGGGPPSTMAGPYPGQVSGTPPRFFQHQGIGPPPPSNAAALGMHHMQPHGNERMHFMQQHPRHMPPHMYRPPTSIYGNPYQGQHAPPPHLQRPQLDPHGVRPMHPQDYSNAYLPPQFGPYIPGHPPNSHIRGPAPEDPKGKKGGPPPTASAPPPGGPPPHPSQLAHYEALKAAGGPMYNPPYPGGHPVPGMRHPGDQQQGHPEAPNRSEFGGLVSYFSAQHDDLEQQ